ncbi:MAG: hypothetical protein ACUVTN_05350 [Thermodesulfobacteriota bacterium]
MKASFFQYGRVSIFDDKGEVKGLVESLLQEIDPEVTIERIRKMDFSYILNLSKKGKLKEVELGREEIEASQEWRKGIISETLREKMKKRLLEF